MNVFVAEEDQSVDARHLTFRSLSAEQAPLLVPFFTAMNFDERRCRFGAGVSNASISEYCRHVDFTQAEIFGCFSRDDLLAVVELHPLAASADCAELGMASLATEHRNLIFGHLLQLVAFAGGRRCYRTLVCTAEFLDPDILALLRSMGRVASRDDTLHVDLGEYAALLAGRA